MDTINISWSAFIAGYALLIIPLAILLWYRVPIIKESAIAVVRMTVQLLFVGLYLQYIFNLNSFWINGLWLVVMTVVADVSIIRGVGLRMRRFAWPVFISLLIGTAIPLTFFVGLILKRPHLLDAQYAIPIGGMILGNCLRADIIGIRGFYKSVRKSEKRYLLSLAQGARLREAVMPFVRDAYRDSLMPTVATISTIGLVSLPGMMTGVILGGASPMVAIKYQVAIMIAIVTGTVITVSMAITLTLKSSFTRYGVLDKDIFV